MEGAQARNCCDTCCGSFEENRGGLFKNLFKTPESKLEVECDVANCLYNDDHQCRAERITIAGDGATINIMMAATMAEGETILENVAKEPHVVDVANFLNSMGANIKVEGNTAIIDGVEKLTGARVSAPDLRAGAALVLAGLAADGYTTVDEIGYVERGYENFEEKLRSLGAVIERVDSEKEAQKFRLRVG